MPHVQAAARARRLALLGLLTNALLAAGKLAAGILGHSYALIADAVESLADIAGSAIIWGGLQLAARPASSRHPYGYGKAEALASLAVALLLIGAGVGIAVESVREIITPHHTPAAWTLAVLAAVVVIKWLLYRAMRRAAAASGSHAAKTDAWHHIADAITSLAAFLGISIAVIGKHFTRDDRFAPADDVAALLASIVIIASAARLLANPFRELLDAQDDAAGQRAAQAAAAVPGVMRVQKVAARRSGARHWIDMHIWVDPAMTVRDGHHLAHAVKDAVRAADPAVLDVLIHVEPASSPPDSPRTVESLAAAPAPGAQDRAPASA